MIPKLTEIFLIKESVGKLIILRGVSGSGKSTAAKKIARENPGAIIASSDDFFDDNGIKFDTSLLWTAHKSNIDKVNKAMISGAPMIIVDNTNIKTREMKPYKELADKHGYEVRIIRMPEIDADVAADRNIHGVPKEKIKAAQDSMRNPLPAGWSEEYYETD